MESLHSTRTLQRLARIALAAIALLAFAAPVRAATDAQEFKLANGLRVIVKEDHRAPTIVSMVWYKAGSMDEFNGTTGVAHVLEHMMFKGTKTLKPGEFSKIVAAAGGRENAFTNRDYTAYYQQLHKSKLPLSFRLEADRMANLKLAPEEFAKEIQVVMEERRLRTDDQPQALVYEQLMAAAFTSHPYRVPVIGWMDDLQHMTWRDARIWYDRWYVPNNALVVVVGDIKAKEVFDLAQKYFGGIKARPLPERKPQDEAPQKGARRVTVKAPADLPYLMMGYRVPRLIDPERDWEPYALEVLAGVLDGNEAARLNASLVRDERVANAVSAGYDSTARGPQLFMVAGAPTTGKTVDDLERGLRRELAKIVSEGVGEEELKRVKAQVVAQQVFQRDSMFFQAQQIGSLETAGYPYRTIDLMISKIQQVTAAQVQEVAKKYLIDDELTVAVLDPQPLAGKKRPPAAGGDQHVH